VNEERWTWDRDDFDGTNTECVRANVFERHATESNTIKAKSSADVMKYDRLIDIQVGHELNDMEMVICVQTTREYDLRNGERPTTLRRMLAVDLMGGSTFFQILL
jgi:hypothetical protein